MKIHSLSLTMSMAYLIEQEEGFVLVDAGLRGEEGKVLDSLKRLNHEQKNSGDKPLRLIYLTHAHIDHCGAAAAIRRRTDAPIAIHRADAEALSKGETHLGSAKGVGRLVVPLLPLLESFRSPEPAEADLLVDDGQSLAEFGLDAWVKHTPGHTAGSSALIVEDTVAFAGDLVSSSGRPHLQKAFAHNWAAIRQSFRQLVDLDLQRIYPGHGRQPLGRAEIRRLVAELGE